MGANLANSKTPAILRAEIILKSSGFSGIFLAVEGDFDSRFWGARIDTGCVRIVHCGGKPNLLGLLDLYDQHSYHRLMAIADADFDRLSGNLRSLWCLVYTDTCDLESTLISSAALQRILVEYGDVSKIQHFETVNGFDVREHVREISSCFGKFRFINSVRDYGVDFDKLSPYRYVDTNSWILDEQKLGEDFLTLANITSAQLASDQHQLFSQLVFDPWSLVQGHDCMKILAIGLGASAIGRPGQKSIDQAELQKAFRLTFDQISLEQTRMYQGLVDAQKAHGLQLF